MILERIKKEQKQARLARDKFKASILTTLMAEVAIVGKNAQRETTDEEATKVITKFLKGTNENMDILIKLGDTDRIPEIAKEMAIYKSFLPQQLTEDELKVEIVKFLETNKPNMGALMGYLKNNFNGQYDGKMANQLFKSLTNA
jgi:uncharacterized protein YqeY